MENNPQRLTSTTLDFAFEIDKHHQERILFPCCDQKLGISAAIIETKINIRPFLELKNLLFIFEEKLYLDSSSKFQPPL